MKEDEKFQALTALVREARAADKATFDALQEATARWKSANETLTERNKVLDRYVQQLVREATCRHADR